MQNMRPMKDWRREPVATDRASHQHGHHPEKAHHVDRHDQGDPIRWHRWPSLVKNVIGQHPDCSNGTHPEPRVVKAKRVGKKSTHFIIVVRGADLVVSLLNGKFKAIYYKPPGRPNLILRERTRFQDTFCCRVGGVCVEFESGHERTPSASSALCQRRK